MSNHGDKLPESLETLLYEIQFDTPPNHRDARFEDLCEEHPSHAEQLRAHRETLRLSDQLLGELPSQLSDALAGESVGPFSLERVLGEGGFGTVFLAHQREPVERFVALKVLQVGRTDLRSRQRFEDERQLLARMQHTCIAQIFDAGITDDHRPYFAMEFVDGAPITDWCREHNTSIDERLRLFTRVCAAIHYAHQHEIVHRDIKPSNVLVCEQDGSAMPKVIDFGIAKLLAEPTLEPDRNTAIGALIGTPGYMSPEQALGQVVDARTDVFSLGVMLCELLIDRPPLKTEVLDPKNLTALAQALQDSTPSRPSSLLPPSRRSSELMRRLREDLDWIVIKATSTDRANRYSSVAALAEDVERHLNGNPVEARQRAATYVIRKFVRRHRLFAIVAAVVVISSIVSIASLAWGLETSKSAQAQAEADRDLARSRSRAARMAVAQLSLASGDRVTAFDTLKGIPPQQRGWEWRHLVARLEHSTSQFPVSPNTIEVAWIDDKRIGTFPHLDRPKIWDADSGTLLGELPLDEMFRHVAIDQEQERALIATDESWTLWDTASYELVRSYPKEPGEALGMAWSDDRAWIALTDSQKRLSLVDAISGTQARLIELDQKATALRFVGDLLVLGYAEGAIEARTCPNASLVWRAEGHTDDIEDLVAHKERDILYSSSVDGSIRAWRLADQSLIAEIPTGMRICRLALSNDGEALFGGGGWERCTLCAWSTTSQQMLGRFNGHTSGIRSIGLSSNGERLASASRDGTLRLWSSIPPKVNQRLEAGYDARVLSVSPTGDHFAAATMNGQITVWDAKSLEETLQFETEDVWLSSALGRSNLYLAGRVDDQMTIRCLDLTDGSVLQEREIGSDYIGAMHLDAEERWLVGGYRGYMLIWSLPDLELRHRVDLPTQYSHRIWDAESGCFLVGGEAGVLFWVDPETGMIRRERRLIETDQAINGLTKSGDLLAFGVGEKIHILKDGKPHLQLDGSSTCLEIFENGSRLASTGFDLQVRIWDLKTGDLLLVLGGPVYGMLYVHAVNDGNRLIALSHRWNALSYVFA